MSLDGGWLINRSKIDELNLIEKNANSCREGERIYVLVETAWDGVANTRLGLMEAKVLKVDTEYGWLRCRTFKQYLCMCKCNWSTKADVYLSNGKVYSFKNGAQYEREIPPSPPSRKWSVEEINEFERKMEIIGSDGRNQWQFLYGLDKWNNPIQK